jgi:hypothetical protein
MVSEPILCRRCARSAASATGCWGASLRTTAWSARRRWLGETARDVAKGLPIWLLHGGSHAAWLAAHGLMEEHPVLPLMTRLEKELRGCRREVYLHMGQRDAAWLAKVETHVREEKAGEALSRRGCGGGRAQAAAAAVAREACGCERRSRPASSRGCCRTSLEDRCLNCVRLVLQGEGWPARSWQQDGLLVEDMDGRRQLRGGGSGGEPAVARLEAAMRKAEAAVLWRRRPSGGRPARQGLFRRAGGRGAAADGRPWRPETGDGGGARGGESGACGGRGGRWAGAAAAADAASGGEGGGGY